MSNVSFICFVLIVFSHHLSFFLHVHAYVNVCIQDSPAVSIANELCPRLIAMLDHVIKEVELNKNLSINMISSTVAHLTRELLLEKPNNLPSDYLLNLVKNKLENNKKI